MSIGFIIDRVYERCADSVRVRVRVVSVLYLDPP